jgi:hypothetical protein
VISTRSAFEQAGPRPAQDATAPVKKNYAERLSRHLASALANALRPAFPGITPDADGCRQEAPARTAKGVKKLDVNYSTTELGLGLGVSIKTVNFRDQKTKRYTKNYTRVDAELRAEAKDYHERQPYAIMVAVIFLPIDSCDDGSLARANPSSFGFAVKSFRHRNGRIGPRQEEELFERVFIGVYDHDGETWFFDVTTAPPWAGRPAGTSLISFRGLAGEIQATYDARNDPPFAWSDRPGNPPAIE